MVSGIAIVARSFCWNWPAARTYSFAQHSLSHLQCGRTDPAPHSSLVTSKSVAGFFFLFVLRFVLRLRRRFDRELRRRSEFFVYVDLHPILSHRPAGSWLTEIKIAGKIAALAIAFNVES